MAPSDESLHRVARDVERLGGVSLTIPRDVSDQDACAYALRETLRCFGRLDALLDNPGIFQPLAFIAQADPKAWKYNIEVNLLGPFYMTTAAIPEVRKSRGRIANVTSGAAHIPMPA